MLNLKDNTSERGRNVTIQFLCFNIETKNIMLTYIFFSFNGILDIASLMEIVSLHYSAQPYFKTRYHFLPSV